MRINYSFSQWNDLITKTRYNRKPTIREVQLATKNKKLITKDNLIIFSWETGCEVRAITGDMLMRNRYSDVYHIN